MTPADENILVVGRSLFDQLGSFQGLNFEPGKYLPAILLRGNHLFVPRSKAENDPNYKQIIPYVMLAFEDNVLYYIRGKRAGEQRLVAKGSIGIGGHLNDGDAGLFNLDEEHYNRVVEREVHEEIHLIAKFQNRIVALLNDDTTDVGRSPRRLIAVCGRGDDRLYSDKIDNYKIDNYEIDNRDAPSVPGPN